MGYAYLLLVMANGGDAYQSLPSISVQQLAGELQDDLVEKDVSRNGLGREERGGSSTSTIAAG